MNDVYFTQNVKLCFKNAYSVKVCLIVCASYNIFLSLLLFIYISVFFTPLSCFSAPFMFCLFAKTEKKINIPCYFQNKKQIKHYENRLRIFFLQFERYSMVYPDAQRHQIPIKSVGFRSRDKSTS